MEYKESQLSRKTTFDNGEPVVKAHRMLPYLIVFTGNEGWKRFRIGERKMKVGRSSHADIRIDDERISGIHCTIDYRDGNMTIEDQNSTNGTYVDGKKIKKKAITIKSKLQIGQCVMKIEYKDESEILFEDELFRKATTDAMTGISNRDYFMKRAKEEIIFAQRTEMPIGIVMVDIDFFKQVNDTFGHLAGDYVINQLSIIVNDEKRTEDLFGRYGGEEFILLLRGKLNRDGAISFCERIRNTIETYTFQFDNKKIPVTVSLGLCLRIGKDIESLDDLVYRADMALYQAKQNGRNRVECDCM
ncbi:MAG: GGDEF domain-containing protein [Thermodesulfobacteriota bacterium]|nr:GGDEF domain-containing protein [Thermodesulfobacteriota bacterium]